MTTITEALRLAQALNNRQECEDEAADELRRLYAENERLAAEVANRNRRALAGDEAVAALANVHAHYEGLEAQRDALLEALKAAIVRAELRREGAVDVEVIRAAIKAMEGEQA